MQALKQKLITQIGVFAIFLILFIDNTEVESDTQAVIVAMNNTVQSQTLNGVVQKPSLQQVGDAAFAPLETGAQISGNARFISAIPFLQGIFDALEGGAGNVVAFFKGIIAGHKAGVASTKTA